MASIRIRELLKQVVPEEWLEAQFEVVAAGQEEDNLCAIVGPIRNQDSNEEIHDFPEGLHDAVEDYWLANLSYSIGMKRLLFRLGTLKPGSKYIGTEYFYD